MNDEPKADEDCRDLERAVLKKLRESPDRPRVLEYFEKQLFEPVWKDQDAKRVGLYCNFVPPEVIRAAGAVPVRLDRACGGFGVEVDLVVVPDRLKNPPESGAEVFALRVPDGGSEQGWIDEWMRLGEVLQGLTGQKLAKNSLQDAVLAMDRQAHAAQKLNQLRLENRPAISGADAMLVMQAAFVADPAEWVDNAEILHIELEQRTAPDRGRSEKARILLTGAPVLWPDYQVLFDIIDSGAFIVADDLCAGSRHLGKPTVLVDMTLPGMLRTAMGRTQKSCIADAKSRQDNLMELAETFRADGIIHLTREPDRGCGLDSAGLAEAFSQRGVGWLDVQVGSHQEAVGQFVSGIAKGKL